MGDTKLFSPFRLRELELPNRIVISPMGQYSADESGRATDWHLMHLGHLAMSGAGLLFTEATAVQAQGQSDKETIPNKIHHRVNPGHPTNDAPTAGSTGVVTPAIAWNGGPVMTGSPNVHLIWYGNWAQANGSDNAAGQQIVRDFMAGVGGSPYLQINQPYTGSNGQVSGLIGTTFEATVGYPNGSRLRDSSISTIVSNG